MSSYAPSVASSSSSRPRPRPPQQRKTLEPETAHERHQRMYKLKRAYEGGRRMPSKPSKTELDVLKEKHQFVRTSQADPSTLSWEDQLSLKYYNSLFREFALVNLKHYKSGQIALRWRGESEVLSGIGHLTCASLRCKYHSPSPSLLSDSALLSLSPSNEDEGEDETPLVPVALEEAEMQFGYVEEGEKKSCLVKVVLCRECGRKLRYGREKGRREREGRAEVMTGREQQGRSVPVEEEDEERERDSRRRRRSRSEREEPEIGEQDFGPMLPPEVHQDDRRDRRRSSHTGSTRSRRRSASPDRQRERERRSSSCRH
ncbi:hypothetical protein JCM11641_005278 [Rhodosporidiobolus odoratus]